MRPVRVLWLSKGMGLGGAERLLATMAPRLDPERYVAEIAYVLPWKHALIADIESRGVRTHCLGATRTVEAGWPLRLRRLLATGSYELLHTHSPVPAVAARLSAPKGTPIVHTEHNVWGRYRWPTYALNAMTYGKNDAVLAVSDGVAASIDRPWWSRFGEPPSVRTQIHGVDVDAARRGESARRHARELLDVSDEVPVVGCVANLTPKKDHAGLLEAMVQVRERVPDVRLVLIGTGPLDAELRGRSRTLGLHETVRFLGARDDVPALLPGFDVFALGSRYEGLPIALLEAMASEVAVVATEVGGVPEALRDGREGRLVRPADPPALAQAIADLLDDATLRRSLAGRARERVETSFTIDRAVREVEQVYDELLQLQEV